MGAASGLSSASLSQGCVFSIPASASAEEQRRYCETWVKPYLALAYNHPTIPFFFYASGIVLESFAKQYRECQAVLQDLLKRGQAELLGGLYYDAAPILQAMKDQRDQIEKLNYYVKKNYKTLPRGLWATPGTFDNASVSVFKKIGGEYLIAERPYVESMQPQECFGFIEEKGEVLPVRVYDKTPVQKLQNAQKSEQFMEKLTDALAKGSGGPHMFFAEYHDVADKAAYFKTLEALQAMIEKKGAAHTCVFPFAESAGARGAAHSVPGNASARAGQTPSRPLCRIRTAAYGDEDNESFVKQMLCRPESRLLYGLLQRAAREIEKYKKDKTVRQSASLMLMEAQSHFPFWNFNRPWGIQTMALRQSAYRIIAGIEHMLSSARGSESADKLAAQLLHTDINLDGTKEFLYRGASYAAAVEPEHGALCMLQRRNRAKSWNYCAAYAPSSAAAYAPWSFRESVLPASADAAKVHADMLQSTYAARPVSFATFVSSSKTLPSLIFSDARMDRSAQNSSGAGASADAGFYLEKQYAFKANAVQAVYRVSNSGAAEQSALLAVEVNLTFAEPSADALEISLVDGAVSTPAAADAVVDARATGVHFFHKSHKEHVHLDFSSRARVHMAPVYGCGHLEDGQLYQYTALLCLIPVQLAPLGYEQFSVSLSFSSAR